ncbi:hypothetical protein P7C73_g1920, partial [Tremellales sp. Uapishka_1]
MQNSDLSFAGSTVLTAQLYPDNDNRLDPQPIQTYPGSDPASPSDGAGDLLASPLNGTNQSDRLKARRFSFILSLNLTGKQRTDYGLHEQLGPTSFWNHARFTNNDAAAATSTIDYDLPDLGPGDWIDWAQHLPPDIPITKTIHDDALETFAAYYAPWCAVVDMSAFTKDLIICNCVSRKPKPIPPPKRTVAYSPLLHNAVVYMGLQLLRDVWPESFKALQGCFNTHCSRLIEEEAGDPGPGTVRALNLMSSCNNAIKETSARNTGYIYFGMAFATGQALGLNLNCERYVTSGQMLEKERNVRDATFWTLLLQDLVSAPEPLHDDPLITQLRAMSAGRPPMISDPVIEVHFPQIDVDMDNMPWVTPSRTAFKDVAPGCSGARGMRSTVFHWSCKLMYLLRAALDSIMGSPHRSARVLEIARDLEQWYTQQPFTFPHAQPLPHVLLLHMVYHVTTIYLFRPYYRSHLDITPAPSDRCKSAALAISELLKTYETTHGLRRSPATTVPVVFAAATIRLLSSVSEQSTGPELDKNVRALNELIEHMGQIALTWTEARRGLNVIISLRSEWLPGFAETETELPVPSVVPEILDPDQPLGYPREWDEWLLGQELSYHFFPTSV